MIWLAHVAGWEPYNLHDFSRTYFLVWIFLLNPFRTAVLFWGQITRILSSLSPKRDRGPKRVKSLYYTWYIVTAGWDLGDLSVHDLDHDLVRRVELSVQYNQHKKHGDATDGTEF